MFTIRTSDLELIIQGTDKRVARSPTITCHFKACRRSRGVYSSSAAGLPVAVGHSHR